jgi:hypothetical protein
MTTQTIHIHTFDYGASLSSATLRNVSDDTLVATADTVNEVTADSGLYAAVFGEVSVIAAGEYRLRAVVGGKPINRYVTLDGTNNEVVEARNERLSVLDSAATAALVDLIWDEPLTGATHNVATSSGKRLRQSTAFQQIDSTVIDASATTTTFITGLDSAVDDFYNDSMLVFTDGALAGQVRSIVDYVGATKTIVLEEALTSAPVNGVAFTIVSLHIHPVSQIQSGLATSAALAAAKTILDKVDTGLVVDGAVYQFTANMLELAPAGGGGGGGDATLAKQEEILAQLDLVQAQTDLIGTAAGATTLLAAAVLEPGTITSFPETLTIGDSYTEQNGREIQIPIVDTDGTPLSSTGSLNFADASVTFTLQRSGETDSTRVITGTATFVDPPGTGTGAGAPYAVIELPASETAKGLKKYKYSGILTFTWTGTGTDVMSFETDTVTFDN